MLYRVGIVLVHVYIIYIILYTTIFTTYFKYNIIIYRTRSNFRGPKLSRFSRIGSHPYGGREGYFTTSLRFRPDFATKSLRIRAKSLRIRAKSLRRREVSFSATIRKFKPAKIRARTVYIRFALCSEVRKWQNCILAKTHAVNRNFVADDTFTDLDGIA